MRAAPPAPIAFGDDQDVYARDETLSVRSRRHPDYEAPGVRAGVFLFYPQLATSLEFDHNILATPTGPIADVDVVLAPRLLVRSDWNQNAVSLDVGAIARQYAAHGQQDSFQYSVSAAGLLNVRRDLTLTANASHQLKLLPRDADGYALYSITPLLYDDTSAKIDTVKVFNRLRLDGALSFADYRYHDGQSFGGARLDEAFRNRDTVEAQLRADYALSGAIGLFAEETVTHVSRPPGLGDRNATRTLVGPNFEIARLIVGEIGLGYVTSESASTGARFVGNFSARGRLEYFPTSLVTLTLTGGRGVVDSGLPNSPTYLSNTVSGRVDYELLRNLIVSGEAAGSWNRYQLVDRRDQSVSVGFGATWQLNRSFGLQLKYDRIHRTSSGTVAGFHFDDDLASLTLTLRR